MRDRNTQWQIQPSTRPPASLIDAVRKVAPETGGHYVAQLLWQRGIRDPQQVQAFLQPQESPESNPFEFGAEMHAAIARLIQARDRQEKIVIWGDFDADGITATAVLWEGLRQFFTQPEQLSYYIPNRLTESHGLNQAGMNAIASQGCQLIVTCDTGSTNLAEIQWAQTLGIDIIVTDHHTLPAERPPVVAIINPRSLPRDHPMATLSGVAVAYKLIEAFYLTLPEIPQQPLTDLLDLVAIGLIADLVELRGECRYLAQQGLKKLQQQLSTKSRPGIARLLELCKRNGDRPTDISFGIGPRINAVSRIQGDARFCVELLTSRDRRRCEQLAMETELANTRRQGLQKDVSKHVEEQLEKLDLSTTGVIVLTDSQWPTGVLGLVAGQVAQEFGRPTILLTTEATNDLQNPDNQNNEKVVFARGSARSTGKIDLYELVKAQSHLLHRFGGHPFAAGLSLPVENVPFFTEGINRQLREQLGAAGQRLLEPTIQADLVVTVAELGQSLFRELRLLDPYGMGNPSPQLLIQNCWFTDIKNANAKDLKGNKVRFIKTSFQLWDETISQQKESTVKGFPGVWWGHYQEEIPQGRCDAIVELDYNTYTPGYEVRLIAVRPREDSQKGGLTAYNPPVIEILDYRNVSLENLQLIKVQLDPESILMVPECPKSWDEWQYWFRQAIAAEKKLAIAYAPPNSLSPTEIWQQLMGVGKYLSRTGETATISQVARKINMSDRTILLGLKALKSLGFFLTYLTPDQDQFQLTWGAKTEQVERDRSLQQFLAAVAEEQFRHRYFYQVPVLTLQAMAGSVFRTAQETSI